jgi:site-specific DNA-methyltransferase (adenine-specific)
VTTAAGPGPRTGRVRRPTATTRFGSSRRESHDATAFYERFVPPELSSDATVVRPKKVDVIYRHDARDMGKVESNSVALVVTSPPYFAGKEYEESLGHNGVPGTYFEYLALLRDVFEECKRVLEPGGRIAVNVANLGRRPYRSLAGDVTEILQDLGLLLRGEIVWWKGRAAGGSCAWGTFQRPSNPVLRDVTERIVIASKGRFDRALKPEERLDLNLPSTATISRDEFLEATTDLWEIPPESATRVGHPAPFPVELPKRLTELYTYEGDVVLDPFMGAGTSAVAALRTERHYIGFETDKSYVVRANERIAAETARLRRQDSPATVPFRVQLPAVSSADASEDLQARAVREGRQAKDLVGILLEGCGFAEIRPDVRVPRLGIEVSFLAVDQTGHEWAFDVSGAFTSSRAGLRRTETLWKALGKAAVLHEARSDLPLVLLTTDAPTRGSAGYAALKILKGPGRPVFDLVELLNVPDQERLRAYATRGYPDR